MIVVVPVDPPVDGLACRSLAAADVVSEAEAADLYRAAAADAVSAVAMSGGELLVNYRDDETLPDSVSVGDPETACRSMIEDALADLEDVRFERQVGSTPSARIGNTVTHLLEREDASSVAVLEPTAALIRRTEIDGVAMSMRRHEVVLGPDGAGSNYLSAFSEPIDFADAYEQPTLSRLARRGVDAGHSVGFAPTVPTIADERGLAATIVAIEAWRAAGRPVPESTAATVDELELETADGRSISRD
ncbi:hypothetical protein [Halovivax sp.]|uniref:hypothetical protein n=1 Tax=Halovivax sp. TaxID=1935978 RepID=UPI0025C2785A|nr:hypothetical protein [Halovivax sp.]